MYLPQYAAALSAIVPSSDYLTWPCPLGSALLEASNLPKSLQLGHPACFLGNSQGSLPSLETSRPSTRHTRTTKTRYTRLRCLLLHKRLLLESIAHQTMLVPVLVLRACFLVDIPAPDNLDHLHPGLSCSQISVHSVTHLFVAVAAATAGLLQVFVHPSQILVILPCWLGVPGTGRNPSPRLQPPFPGPGGNPSPRTTISFTSFSHTRTRTTLYSLTRTPWIHSYYASTSCKQAAPLPCGRY